MTGHRNASSPLSIRSAQPHDRTRLVHLIAEFRVALAALRERGRALDLEAARAELADYNNAGFPIYVAETDGTVVGYLVCRVVDDVVWAESLYVSPDYRRRGVGSALYTRAEELAQALGGDAPYNWVHPNNEAIIRFLQRRGYTVLNLIELRRPSAGETLTETICVGNHEFDY